jgi:cytochrome oxidase Cu insertion factor (SCO1/SenC/PrrC family)
MRRRAIAALAAGLTLAAGPAPAHEPAPAPRLLYELPPAGSYALPVIQRVSEHWLVDSAGERAPVLGIAEGEAALISFVYGRCHEACPLALAVLRRVDRLLADTPSLAGRVRLVTVSFDPEADSPERMAELRGNLRPKGRWDFLTASDPGALEPVLVDFGQRVVARPDLAPGAIQHVLKIFLVDADGNVRNIYSSGLLEPLLLRNDAATVLGVDPSAAAD